MEDKIHFIMTGGTIDSYYNAIKETTWPNNHSSIQNFIPLLKLYETLDFTEVFMKDSRNINNNNRKKILETIKKVIQKE